jgi:hypothetical protein
MLRKTWDEDKWLLTAQAEHARISGLIAVSWNFSDNKPHDEVKLAISRHDDGWQEADSSPQPNEKGDPRNFMEMPANESIHIAERSISLLYDEAKYYAARLVAGHFVALAYRMDLAHVSPGDARDIGQFIGEKKSLMLRCAASSGRPAPAEAETEGKTNNSERNFEKDLRLLQVCDLLSLLVCGEFSGEMEIEDVPYLADTDKLLVTGRGDLNLGITPMPFKKPLRGLLEAVAVPRRVYQSGEELKQEISTAKVLSREIHLGTTESAKVPNPGAS